MKKIMIIYFKWRLRIWKNLYARTVVIHLMVNLPEISVPNVTRLTGSAENVDSLSQQELHRTNALSATRSANS